MKFWPFSYLKIWLFQFFEHGNPLWNTVFPRVLNEPKKWHVCFKSQMWRLFLSMISLIDAICNIRNYTKLYDIDTRQSFHIVVGISYTTDSIRHVVVLMHIIYDTTRLYAIVVLQVSKMCCHNKINLGWNSLMVFYINLI